MTYIKLGNVLPIPGVQPTREQALKVLEEAAEVFTAWQMLESTRENMHDMLVDHDWDEGCASEVIEFMYDAKYCKARTSAVLADTIQACCNLAASLGVTDMTPYLAACEERNRKRGRYERSGER